MPNQNKGKDEIKEYIEKLINEDSNISEPRIIISVANEFDLSMGISKTICEELFKEIGFKCDVKYCKECEYFKKSKSLQSIFGGSVYFCSIDEMKESLPIQVVGMKTSDNIIASIRACNNFVKREK